MSTIIVFFKLFRMLKETNGLFLILAVLKHQSTANRKLTAKWSPILRLCGSVRPPEFRGTLKLNAKIKAIRGDDPLAFG